MTNNERDTHFAGFAKLLWSEISDLYGTYVDGNGFNRRLEEFPEYEELIAQRAYDLALHTVQECHKWDMGYMEVPDLMTEIPDLTTWPDTSAQ